MNYSEMSDFEINKAVAEALELPVNKKQYMEFPDRDERAVLLDDYTPKDFCNSWADGGPIIEKNQITLGWRCISRDATAMVVRDHTEIKAVDESPLRASMIVFLEIQQP